MTLARTAWTFGVTPNGITVTSSSARFCARAYAARRSSSV